MPVDRQDIKNHLLKGTGVGLPKEDVLIKSMAEKEVKGFIENFDKKNELSHAQDIQEYIRFFITPNADNIDTGSSNFNRNRFSNYDHNRTDIPFFNKVRLQLSQTESFKSFVKFFSTPPVSCPLVENEIVPELNKVFDAENKRFDWIFKDEDIKATAMEIFNKNRFGEWMADEFWEQRLNNYNDIVITDFNETGIYRQFVSIHNVLAVQEKGGNITKIAFNGFEVRDGKKKDIVYYYNETHYYAFHHKGSDYTLVKAAEHNLGMAPAMFISPVLDGGKGDFITRRSLFVSILEKMERYCFYDTLNKMYAPNGLLPITIMLKPENHNCTGPDGFICQGGQLKRQSPDDQKTLVDAGRECPKCKVKALQAGTVIEIPLPQKGEESIAKDFLHFHRMPVESLAYMDEKIKKLKEEIRKQGIGQEGEGIENEAKNELQVSMSLNQQRNTLIALSREFSKTQEKIDTITFKLLSGDGFVRAVIDHGNDYYLEGEFELREQMDKTNNPHERGELSERIIKTASRDNPKKALREQIIKSVMPYFGLRDAEFATFVASGNIADGRKIELRNNFVLYLAQFEAEFGRVEDYFAAQFAESESFAGKIKVLNTVLNKLIDDGNNDTEKKGHSNGEGDEGKANTDGQA